MDIEKFFDQPYADRQLVEFVDDSKLEKKSLWVAILEDDKLFVASAAGIASATRWVSIPIGIAALGIKRLLNKSELDIPNSESKNLLQLLSPKKLRGSGQEKDDMEAPEPSQDSSDLGQTDHSQESHYQIRGSDQERDDMEAPELSQDSSGKEGKSDRKSHQKYQKKGVVITLIGKSDIEHFKLPPTHPHNHTIYVAHPLLREEYNPLANFHRFTFEDKFNELLRLLSHLGAKTIAVYHMRGWGAEFAAHLGVHLGSSNAAKGGSRQQAEQSPKANVDTHRDTEQTLLYQAVLQGHTPSMPEGLKWYYAEPNWQQIVDQRLHHGLQSFSLYHRYTDDFGINIKLGGKLTKAGFGLGGNFEGYTATEWHVTGEF